MPQIVEEIVGELIVDFSATDHGRNRGSFQRVRGAAAYGGVFGESAVGWFFSRISVFFALLRVVPELSASANESSTFSRYLARVDRHMCQCHLQNNNNDNNPLRTQRWCGLLFTLLCGLVVSLWLMLVLSLACWMGPLGVILLFVLSGFGFVYFVCMWLFGLLKLGGLIVFWSWWVKVVLGMVLFFFQLVLLTLDFGGIQGFRWAWGTANDALRGQRTVTSTEVGPADYFELSSDDGRPTGGERPAALLEPRPRGKVQWHAGIGYEIVQNLDVPVLQVVEQLPDVLQFFATCLPVVAEHVIEVPKISQDRTQQCLGDCLRQPQMADQLVHVPTVVSDASLQQQSRSSTLLLLMVAAFVAAGEVFMGYAQGQGSTALGGADPVDIPVPHSGGLQGFFPRQGSTASSSSSHVGAGAADEPFRGFFALFPRGTKCGVGSALGVGTGCGL